MLQCSPACLSTLYLAAVVSLGGSPIWFWLLARGQASLVSSYFFLTPALGLLLAAVVLGEPFPPRQIPGLLVVVSGIALVQRG